MFLEIAEQWANALESGRFDRGKLRLRGLDDTYCCLGVLCELYRREHPDIAEWIRLRDLYAFRVESDQIHNDATAYLPSEVMDWAGMSSLNGTWDRQKHFATLSHMNDNSPAGFPDIALAIRRHAKEL